MKSKRIFIVCADKDKEIVKIFRNLLELAIKRAHLSDKVTVEGMWNFPQDGTPFLTSNEEAIRQSDIFVLLVSPAFTISPTISKREVPAILHLQDKDPRRKATFWVKLMETAAPYTDNLFVSEINFYTSEKASELKWFGNEIGIHTESQRQLFIEELVQKMTPFINTERSNQIRDVKDLPHVDDFLKGKRRSLRVCKESDLLLTAEYFMANIYPPIRHLLVIDERQTLAGVISIRDILKFGFKNKVKVVGNLNFLDDEAKNALVSSLYVPRDEMVYLSLSEENKIENLIQEFIKSPTTGRPIGIVPVIRTKGDFSIDKFEVVSYIDILKNWRQLIGSKRTEQLTALDFRAQEKIEVVCEDDQIVVATKKVAEGVRSIPVLDGNDRFLGMLSDNDLMNLQAAQVQEKISSILKKDRFATISPTMRFGAMADLFLKHRKYTSLPVLDEEGKIEKIIGYTDLLKQMHSAILEESES